MTGAIYKSSLSIFALLSLPCPLHTQITVSETLTLRSERTNPTNPTNPSSNHDLGQHYLLRLWFYHLVATPHSLLFRVAVSGFFCSMLFGYWVRLVQGRSCVFFFEVVHFLVVVYVGLGVVLVWIFSYCGFTDVIWFVCRGWVGWLGGRLFVVEKMVKVCGNWEFGFVVTGIWENKTSLDLVLWVCDSVFNDLIWCINWVSVGWSSSTLFGSWENGGNIKKLGVWIFCC